MLKQVLGATAAIVITAAAMTAAPARAQTLNVGDPAPKLTVKEFVKGQKVSSFEKGKVYVVEFWATWCGPCRQTIPHLTSLAKTYPNVKFIGVSVFEHEKDQRKVKPFVAEMGDKMNYTVCMDSIPDGKDPGEGAMATNWMEAAGQDGIPTAFIVNGDSKIAWIGHPMQMEEPLKAVVTGKWDVKAEAAKAKKEAATKAKFEQIGKDFTAAMRAGDHKKAVAVLDAAIADDPEMETRVGLPKYFTLAASGDEDAASKYGTRLVETVYADNPGALNQLAWSIIDPKSKEKPGKSALATALAAAKRANTLTQGKNPDILDTLALAYYDSGDAKMALSTQETAIAAAKDQANQEMKDRLEMYRKAAAQP